MSLKYRERELKSIGDEASDWPLDEPLRPTVYQRLNIIIDSAISTLYWVRTAMYCSVGASS